MVCMLHLLKCHPYFGSTWDTRSYGPSRSCAPAQPKERLHNSLWSTCVKTRVVWQLSVVVLRWSCELRTEPVCSGTGVKSAQELPWYSFSRFYFSSFGWIQSLVFQKKKLHGKARSCNCLAKIGHGTQSNPSWNMIYWVTCNCMAGFNKQKIS